MLASYLAQVLNYDFVGEDIAFSGISYAVDAMEGDIAVARNAREAALTSAKVVLMKPAFVDADKTIIFCHDELDYAMVRVCSAMIHVGLLKDYSIPTSYEKQGTLFVGKNVRIGCDCVIQPGVCLGDDVVVGDNCILGANSVIGSGTTLGKNVVIGPNSVIGADSFFHYADDSDTLLSFVGVGNVAVGNNSSIGSNTVVQRGTLSCSEIGPDCQIGNSIDIGHDVKIGRNCKIVSLSGIAGNAKIGNRVTMFGQSSVANHVNVGDGCVIMARTSVTKSIKKGDVVMGPWGRYHLAEKKLIAKLNRMFKEKEL